MIEIRINLHPPYHYYGRQQTALRSLKRHKFMIGGVLVYGDYTERAGSLVGHVQGFHKLYLLCVL